jgi:DNA-binding PucR family transcriptional regulator
MKALRVLQQMGRFERFVEHSKVNLFAKLFEVGDAARIARYVGEILLPIDKRDPKQKTRLKQTLLCFFECQYNTARTATQMGLHINTVRQRLETLREITGGWDDPVAALELPIALWMNDTVE